MLCVCPCTKPRPHVFYHHLRFNLASPTVLNMLFPILEGRGYITLPDNGRRVVAAPGFRFFATQNGASYSNRHLLPMSLRSRFVEVQFADFTESELSQIVRNRRESGGFPVDDERAEKVAKLYQLLRSDGRASFAITMREIIKWTRRKKSFLQAPWDVVGYSLLDSRLKDGAARAQLKTCFDQAFQRLQGLQVLGHQSAASIRQNGDTVTFSDSGLELAMQGFDLARSPLWQNGRQPPASFIKCLCRVAFCVKHREPVLLIGPSSCKTLLVHTWMSISGHSELVKVFLTSGSESTDLLGDIRPYSFHDLLSQLPIAGMELMQRYKVMHSKLAGHQQNTIQSTLDDWFSAGLPDIVREIREQMEAVKKSRLRNTPQTEEERAKQIEERMRDALRAVQQSQSDDRQSESDWSSVEGSESDGQPVEARRSSIQFQRMSLETYSSQSEGEDVDIPANLKVRTLIDLYEHKGRRSASGSELLPSDDEEEEWSSGGSDSDSTAWLSDAAEEAGEAPSSPATAEERPQQDIGQALLEAMMRDERQDVPPTDRERMEAFLEEQGIDVSHEGPVEGLPEQVKVQFTKMPGPPAEASFAVCGTWGRPCAGNYAPAAGAHDAPVNGKRAAIRAAVFVSRWSSHQGCARRHVHPAGGLRSAQSSRH